MAIAVARTVALELDQLRALGKSRRAAALSAMRRRAADARPAAYRDFWENAAPVVTLDADAQSQVSDLRSGGVQLPNARP